MVYRLARRILPTLPGFIPGPRCAADQRPLELLIGPDNAGFRTTRNLRLDRTTDNKLSLPVDDCRRQRLELGVAASRRRMAAGLFGFSLPFRRAGRPAQCCAGAACPPQARNKP